MIFDCYFKKRHFKPICVKQTCNFRDLGIHLKRSFLSIPESSPVTMTTSSNSIETIARAARNNLPDDATVTITRDIVKYAESLTEQDLCICLISGLFELILLFMIYHACI